MGTTQAAGKAARQTAAQNERTRTTKATLTPAHGATGLRTAPWGLIALAVMVGAGAGAGSIVFRWCITAFTHLFSGHADYAAAPGTGNPHVPWLGPYFV